jgi:hypothetical protein
MRLERTVIALWKSALTEAASFALVCYLRSSSALDPIVGIIESRIEQQ